MKMVATPTQTLAKVFDRLVTSANIRKFEVLIIRIAVTSFAIHLGLIFMMNHGIHANRGETYGYLKAIYTPFSFVLVYEVFLMVVILPESMSEFIGKQFEIITLITLRSFFHDVGEISAHTPLQFGQEAVMSIGQDLTATVLMCALTAVFHRLHARHRDQGIGEPLKKFVDLKKTAASVLMLVLLITSIQSLVSWVSAVIPAITSQVDFPNPNVFFYSDFYSIMIIADVFLLVISLLYDSTFYSMVRNASFVISTILLRLSLGAERPMNHLLAIGSLVFTLAILMVLRIRQRQGAAGAPA